MSLGRLTKKGSLWSVILCLTVVLALAGCGKQANNASSSPSDSGASPSASASSSATAAADASDDQVRVVEHAMGKTEIKGKPKKVVVLTNEGTEAVLALGIKPVGAVRSWTGNPWYDHIAAEMEGVTEVGEESQPNIELIAGLQPDLIIGNKMRQEKIYDQLSAIAPTVMSEDLRGNWKVNFKLYAEALGLKEEGDQILADFDKRIEDFRNKAGDKLKETVSVVRFMDGKTRVYHTNTFSGIIFEQIGLARNEMTKNAKDTFVDEITKERLPEVDADRLFYFTYETGDGKASKTEEEWTNDPLWKNLKAVKNGKAYKVDDAIWNTAGGIKAANLLLDQLYKIYELE
ncbi:MULTISPECIES: ABC transporter substrate-binding protein [Cohnella]|jgi:iron complex transport system substrate-binding protein|uniref:ABC transporter substrate-binding protein n=1 Tax=Cohnella TaxID=329857 RepID=UPI00039DB62F|nr:MULTISPECIES: iron-siderophore ABC transporter substrate-binding protein [Cohnella]REK68799.1 MAG: iron-siderophore ABC transporter substrate-binding protein [Cohnella sp.]